MRKLIAPLVVLIAVVSGCNTYDDARIVNAAVAEAASSLPGSFDRHCVQPTNPVAGAPRFWQCDSGIWLLVTPHPAGSSTTAHGVLYRDGAQVGEAIFFFEEAAECRARVDGGCIN